MGLLTLCLGCTISVFEMDPQACPCGIYGRQNGTGTDILPHISAFPIQSSFCRCSILIYLSSYGWTTNPLHTAAPQRRGLPCHKRIKKQLWAQRRKFTHQSVTDGIKHNVLNIATVAPSYGVKYRVFVLRAAWLLQYCAWANRVLLFSTVSLSMLVLQTKYHWLQLQLVFNARVKFRLVANIIVLQCLGRAFCRTYWGISGRAEKTAASWEASYLSAVFIFSLEWVISFLRPSRVVCSSEVPLRFRRLWRCVDDSDITYGTVYTRESH